VLPTISPGCEGVSCREHLSRSAEDGGVLASLRVELGGVGVLCFAGEVGSKTGFVGVLWEARGGERARPVFSAAEIEETVLALGGLTDVLQRADAELRARLYGQLGLEVVCDPDKRQVRVEIEVCRGTVRVGGGT